MRLHRVSVVIAAVLLLANAASSQGNKSPEARLRAAMDKETVDGDLSAATTGYKQIISDGSANRAVVAQALLRLGMAYEKQGSQEASASYERLVREFGDQPTVVQLAKARMSAAAAAGPTLRQVCSWECEGEVSPDGRKLLFVRNGGLAVSELGSTGSVRQVVPASSTGAIRRGHFSPDARRIVYTVRPAQGGASKGEISVVDTDGRNARAVYHGADAESWSADGRRILATVNEERTPTRLLWINIADGRVQPIPTSSWENIDVFVPSPDGRYIAFSGNRDETTKENVFVIASDGSGESRVSPSPSYQEPVGWSRDGKYLLYGEFGESPTLWAVPMVNGKVQGAPVVVRRFESSVSFRGITSSGVLHYRTTTSGGGVYTASMDPTSGKVTSVPAVLPMPNPGGPGAWSPDSRRIAFLNVGPERELHVFTLGDGKDQRVPAKVSFINSLCWPRGGESVLTNTITDPGGRGPNGVRATRIDVVRVDLASGETRPMFPSAPTFRLWNCSDTTAASIDPLMVKVRNIDTGTETELYRRKRVAPDTSSSGISPDGRFVAFLESLDSDTVTLMVVPSGGGPARELTRTKLPAQLQPINGYDWSPDSRYVYFFKRTDSQAPHKLYRIPVTGGAEESMGLEGMELRGMKVAPNGRQILFVIGPYLRPEIWAMDNFLPTGK